MVPEEGEPPRAAPKRLMVPTPEGEPPRAAPKRQMVPAPKARLAWGGGALPAKNGAAATGPAPAGAATTEAPTGSPSVLLGLPGLPMGNVLAQRGGSSAGARRFVPPLPNRCLEGRCRCPDLSITRGPGPFEVVAPRQQNSQRRESGGTGGRPADPRPEGGRGRLEEPATSDYERAYERALAGLSGPDAAQHDLWRAGLDAATPLAPLLEAPGGECADEATPRQDGRRARQ